MTFGYAAEHENLLSLNVGDIITNIDCQVGGWWEGILNGKRGMFPESFAEGIEDEGSGLVPTSTTEGGISLKYIGDKIFMYAVYIII